MHRAEQAALLARSDAFDKFLHGRHETIGIERILLETPSICTAEHEIMLSNFIRLNFGKLFGNVGDVLQAFLDAERSRVSLGARREAGPRLTPI